MQQRVDGLEQAVSGYRSNGFAMVSGLFRDAELASLRAEAERLCGQLPTPQDSRGLTAEGDHRPDRLDPVIDISPCFAALSADPRLLDLAGRCLAGPPRLLKDKFVAKPPGERGYGLHQDAPYWHGIGLDAHRTLSLAICLDRCDMLNGTMEFAPGHHRQLLCPPGKLEDPDESLFDRFEPIIAEAGDVLVFSALAPHRSGRNTSATHRRVLFLTYACDGRADLYDCFRQLRKSNPNESP